MAAFAAGGLGVAVVNGVFALLQFFVQRRARKKDEKEDENDVIRKALQYLLLYNIEERCKFFIERGEISLDELRKLHKWHKIYHDGLGGNGDADALMKKVENLKLTTED